MGTLATLDGSGSVDPNENYPLSYSWEFIFRPEGSTAYLDDPASPFPNFIADMIGDYRIQLIVTDSIGLSSVPDEVLVSTSNSTPIADAGPDQAIIEIGTTVQLDGCPNVSRSWDDDGDPITFSWSFVNKPLGSEAVISDPNICDPTFVADIHGEYEIELVVSDPWESSEPDRVIVSFENVRPVAVAGNNQSVVQGDTVYLDGSGSYDANLDPLTYNWSIVSKPADSLAEIDDPSPMQTHFDADLPGEYIVSLIVNDGFVDSDPSNITAVAISYQDASTDKLQETINAINGLDDIVLKNPTNKNALTNKINAALAMIDQGLYQEARDKLENDISGKTDGCAEAGSPDKNDWIRDCVSQNEVYPLVMEAIELLDNLI